MLYIYIFFNHAHKNNLNLVKGKQKKTLKCGGGRGLVVEILSFTI